MILSFLIADCGKSYHLEYGHINFTGHQTTVNQTVPINCHLGYEVHGDHHIKCLEDGSWTTNSVCKIKGQFFYSLGTIYHVNNSLHAGYFSCFLLSAVLLILTYFLKKRNLHKYYQSFKQFESRFKFVRFNS